MFLFDCQQTLKGEEFDWSDFYVNKNVFLFGWQLIYPQELKPYKKAIYVIYIFVISIYIVFDLFLYSRDITKYYLFTFFLIKVLYLSVLYLSAQLTNMETTPIFANIRVHLFYNIQSKPLGTPVNLTCIITYFYYAISYYLHRGLAS